MSSEHIVSTDKKPNKKRKYASNLTAKVANVLQSGNLVDFYRIAPQDKDEEKAREYKTYSNLKIKWPFQAIIVGATGSGKTNFILNLIEGIGEIEFIFLFAKKIDEPLYKYLIKEYEERGEKAGKQLIYYSNDISKLPDVNRIESVIENSKALLIVDDFVNEPSKNLQSVSDAYSMGRKAGKAGLSCVFLSQQFYKTPKFIRDNASLICIGKLYSTNDLLRISTEYTLDKSPEELATLHTLIQENNTRNFLTIDLTKSSAVKEQAKYKYRQNLAPINL